MEITVVGTRAVGEIVVVEAIAVTGATVLVFVVEGTVAEVIEEQL